MSILLELVRARRAELEREQQAKPRVTIVTCDGDRINAVEALFARQRDGTLVLGDAERLKAVEAIFARAKERQRREADLGAAGSPVVSKTRTSDVPYETTSYEAEPARPAASKPEYIDSPLPLRRARGVPVGCGRRPSRSSYRFPAMSSSAPGAGGRAGRSVVGRFAARFAGKADSRIGMLGTKHQRALKERP